MVKCNSSKCIHLICWMIQLYRLPIRLALQQFLCFDNHQNYTDTAGTILLHANKLLGKFFAMSMSTSKPDRIQTSWVAASRDTTAVFCIYIYGFRQASVVFVYAKMQLRFEQAADKDSQIKLICFCCVQVIFLSCIIPQNGASFPLSVCVLFRQPTRLRFASLILLLMCIAQCDSEWRTTLVANHD